MHKPKAPVPTEEMQRRGNKNQNSICQKLREIYELTDDEQIKIKCRVAVAMARAMVGRLNKYKASGK